MSAEFEWLQDYVIVLIWREIGGVWCNYLVGFIFIYHRATRSSRAGSARAGARGDVKFKEIELDEDVNFEMTPSFQYDKVHAS